MGRTGLIEKIRETITVPNNRDHTWLLAYDFPGFNPSPHFYTLLTEYMEKLDQSGDHCKRIQSSVITTDNLHGAITIAQLARHYDAQVYLAKAEQQALGTIQQENTRLVIKADERHHVIWITSHWNRNQIRKYVKGISEPVIEALLELHHGFKVKIENLTPESTQRTWNHFKNLAENPPIYSLPYTLTGPHVWLVLESLQKHLQHKTGKTTRTAYKILWRLHHTDPPPSFNADNVMSLLKEQPADTWKTQHQSKRT